MADEIKQLIDMVARLKITVDEGFQAIDRRFELIDKRFEAIDKRFEAIDKRFDKVEMAIQELNSNQIKMLNSIKLLENDVRSNKKHIERLEERESFL
jgi:septation ring formation regulator EzrA